jgi:hypothetical protein
MKIAIVALALSIPMFPAITKAQASSTGTQSTVRILAIGKLTVPLTPEETKSILSREVKETVELYLNGKIDQWWFRQDGNGPVFLLNVTSTEEAESLLEKLPLGVAKKMTFQYVPVGPLKPLHMLLGEEAAK